MCHLRFDDTNPEKEEQEYVDAILEMVHWLGFDWRASYTAPRHLYYASDYFDFMYRAAEALIEAGHAYVDEQSAEEMRANRGDFDTPGTDSPFRSRTPAENLARFREMRDGEHADGAMVLRAKIDMASPNINLRDPTLYRIKRATHHNTGDRWCIYPMYTYAHPIEDALENITHSICTLEFEDQRPFYDWLLDTLCRSSACWRSRCRKQYEFARLNLTYIVTSKRKLRQLVEEGIVDGWDDPRMPTLVGLRRRGYTPESLRLLAERSGVSKAGGWIDYARSTSRCATTWTPKAPRAMAVLDPLKLVLTQLGRRSSARARRCPAARRCTRPARARPAPLHARPRGLDRARGLHGRAAEGLPPPEPAALRRQGRAIAGSVVRLKYGYIIQCTG